MGILLRNERDARGGCPAVQNAAATLIETEPESLFFEISAVNRLSVFLIGFLILRPLIRLSGGFRCARSRRRPQVRVAVADV
nr:hypothetical protein [Paraburkholderia sp. BL8N3]